MPAPTRLPGDFWPLPSRQPIESAGRQDRSPRRVDLMARRAAADVRQRRDQIAPGALHVARPKYAAASPGVSRVHGGDDLLWPNLIIQQQSNTLAMRQIVTGPESFELTWTFFGYKGEPDDLRHRRIRQANLMGPAGFVFDDSEVIKFAQEGLRDYPEGTGVMEMGGRDWRESESHILTEGGDPVVLRLSAGDGAMTGGA